MKSKQLREQPTLTINTLKLALVLISEQVQKRNFQSSSLLVTSWTTQSNIKAEFSPSMRHNKATEVSWYETQNTIYVQAGAVRYRSYGESTGVIYKVFLSERQTN